VEGDVKGNLSASDRIELKATARYEGDLRASKLVVDEGAVFSGNVSVGPEAVKARPPQAQIQVPRPAAAAPSNPVHVKA
jgi:cytoskeletal protein CcmA (bactofilin family)